MAVKRDKVEDLKKALRNKPTKTDSLLKLSPDRLLSSGSTLLNLAISGRTNGCFVKGCYHYLVGDSKSGKTFLSLTCLAEAARNSNFDGYRFIHDDVENGALMDMEKFFGKAVAERVEMPSPEGSSSTIEEFFFNVDNAVKAGKPFIYVLDSMDGLSSEAEEDKFQEMKDAHEKGKEVAGSYGDGKAKKNSSLLRRTCNLLRKTDSILIIISQTRDNIGFGATFNPKTRSGGRALRFYATTEWWSSVRKELRVKVRGKDREVGNLIRIDVKKNRLTGKEPTVEIPIYHDTGFDDIGSMIAFLCEESHWEVSGKKKDGTGGTISATEFGVELPYDQLVAHVEDNNLKKELKASVKTVWDDILERSTVKRKNPYTS